MFTAVKEILNGYEIITLKGAGHEARILPGQHDGFKALSKDS